MKMLREISGLGAFIKSAQDSKADIDRFEASLAAIALEIEEENKAIAQEENPSAETLALQAEMNELYEQRRQQVEALKKEAAGYMAQGTEKINRLSQSLRKRRK